MHLALEAAGIQAGDEVITTTMTFAATAEVVRYFNARPVLVDIDPTTFNLDVDLLEAAITPRTEAIIPVHVVRSGGRSGRGPSYRRQARSHRDRRRGARSAHLVQRANDRQH